MSLSKKLILVFVGVLISFASLSIIVDNLFADKFYLHEKQRDLSHAYDSARDYVIESEDDIYTISMVMGINSISQSTGTVIYLFDDKGENVTMGPGVVIRSLRGLSVKDDNNNMIRLDSPEKLAKYIDDDGMQVEFSDTNETDGNIRNIAIVGKITKTIQ